MEFGGPHFAISLRKKRKPLCEKPMDVVRKQLCNNLNPKADSEGIRLLGLQPPHLTLGWKHSLSV